MAKRQVVFLASIDWAAAWQRHQAWAKRFADEGWEVFFVENTGFRGLRPSDAGRILHRLKRASSRAASHAPPAGVRVVSPIVLPPTAGAFRGLNRRFLVPRLLKKLKAAGLGPGPVALAYLPTATTLQLLDAIGPSTTVYDCVDNFSGHPSPPRGLAASEEELLRRSALVLTTSPFLQQRHAARHLNVHELHHGVDESFFLDPRPAREYRRFCYFGSLWHAVEYRCAASLASAGFEVDLVGPIREPLPPLPERVRHRPPVAARELPLLLSEYDGLLLPYADTPYNRGVVPAKTFECLATGKPVLASPIGGLSKFGDFFYLSPDPAEWPRIAEALPRTETEEKRQARIAYARRNTTRAQFVKLLGLLEEAERRR